MKYYIASDIHGFYTAFRQALFAAGYFEDAEPHKLILLGDLFDRGEEALELQDFILELMERDEVILIRGNHEDLYRDLVEFDNGVPLRHHRSNGTYSTALQLTDYDMVMATICRDDFTEEAMQTPYYQRIMPAMRNYFETDRYVFVHGWIPCVREPNGYSYCSDWRNASEEEWERARWYNGIDAARTCMEEKTIVCGHWHVSYGHSKYNGKGSEFGEDACFEPYCDRGIIAVDACTSHSGKVNVLVLEDERDVMIDMTDDEKIDLVAARILEKYKGAFLELAK